MEAVDLSQDKGGKRNKQKKMAVRVDFTPMVDMNMLLICFFMLCTSMIKPQTMEINMPSNNENIKDDEKNKVKASEAITLLLDGDNKLYYFEGLPDKENVKETSYGKDGIRQILLAKNQVAVAKVKALRQEYALKKSSNPQKDSEIEAEFRAKLSEIKGEDGVPNVIIKATDKASYKNLIDALDEMQICNIGKYVIDKFNTSDQGMIDYFKSNNGGGASAANQAQ